MLKLEEQELLKHFAYQSWLDRGQPIGSPEVDWAHAQQMLLAYRAEGIEALDAALQEIPAGDAPKVTRTKLQKKAVGKNRRAPARR